MDSPERIVLVVVVTTVLLLLMLGIMVLLMIVNAHRQQRHRAELAEADVRRQQAVLEAERAATQETLGEVGRELHDNVGQLLVVAQMGLNNLIHEGNTDQRLEGARDTLEVGIDEVRRLAHSLNGDLWEQRSLVEAIRTEAARVERVGRIRTSVSVAGPMPEFPKDANTILFRLFQEVVANAIKHSGADRLDVLLSGGPPFSLQVTDNGRGFDPVSTPANAGMANIRRRCALIGFDAHCISSPQEGCTWSFHQTDHHGT